MAVVKYGLEPSQFLENALKGLFDISSIPPIHMAFYKKIYYESCEINYEEANQKNMEIVKQHLLEDLFKDRDLLPYASNFITSILNITDFSLNLHKISKPIAFLESKVNLNEIGDLEITIQGCMSKALLKISN